SLPGLVPQPNPARDAIMLTRSTDDGLTWGPDGGTPIVGQTTNGKSHAQLQYVTVGPDHTVYVFWWDSLDGPTIRMRKSTDQGVTFGPELIVTGLKTHLFGGELGLTDSTGRVFATPCTFQAVVNPNNGDLYVVYHDQANGSADRGDVFFVQSNDGGKHWSKPLRVNDDATDNDQWMPALALTPDGSHLGVFWYDRRLHPPHNLIPPFGPSRHAPGHRRPLR